MTIARTLSLVAVAAVVVAASVLLDAQGQQGARGATRGRAAQATAAAAATGIKADYERAYALRDRLQNTILDVAEAPTWIGRTPKFWYRKSVKGGNAFVLVDGAAKTKGPAFDHDRLAAALSEAAREKYTGVTLPFSSIHVRRRPAVDRVHDWRRRARRGRRRAWRGARRAGTAALALHADRVHVRAPAGFGRRRRRRRARQGEAPLQRHRAPQPRRPRRASRPTARPRPSSRTTTST